MEQNKIYSHLKYSTLLAAIAGLANIGSVAFARRTAEISTTFGPLTYSSVALGTALTAYSAYILLELLKKYTERPYEFFSYIAGTVLILSFMPIGHVATGMPEAGIAEINVLGLTHVVAAAIISVGLAKLELSKQNTL